MKIEFTVPGKLTPWTRPRFNAATKVVFNDKELQSTQALIRDFAARELGANHHPIEDPVRLWVHAYILRPKTYQKGKKRLIRYCASRPDADNRYKTVADALNRLAYRDDSQVADMRCVKEYTDEMERFVVLFETLETL